MSIVANADEMALLMPGGSRLTVAAPEDIDRLVRARECMHLWGMAIGVAMGIFVGLYSDFASDEISSNTKRASFLSTEAFMAYSAASFLMSPVFGVLGDSVGRRSLFLVSVGSTSVVGVVIGLVPIGFVFVTGAALIGCMSGTYALAYAYIVEYTLSTPRGYAGNDQETLLSRTCTALLRKTRTGQHSLQDDLTANFTVLWAHALIGHVIGLILASVLEGWVGLRWAMSFCGWVCVPVVALVYLTLEETKNRTGHALPTCEDMLVAVAKAVMSPQLMASNTFLTKTGFAYFVLVTVYAGIIDVMLFWAEFKFAYYTNSATHQDELLFLLLLSAAVGVVFMNRFLFKKLGIVTTISLVACWSAVAALALGFSQNVIYTIVFAIMGGVAYGLGPAVMSIMTPAIEPARQGHLQGALNAIAAAGYVVGPYAFDYVFKHTADGNYEDGSHAARKSIEANGLWFLAAACLLFVGGMVYHAYVEAHGVPNTFEQTEKETDSPDDTLSATSGRTAPLDIHRAGV